MPQASQPPLGVPPGLHRYSQQERVYHGRDVCQALDEELALIGARRVFLVTNRSLAGTPELARIAATLGGRLVGRFDSVRAHSPRHDVLAGAASARAAQADLLLAVGGGSVIDACKAMLLCLRFDFHQSSQLDPLANLRPQETGHAPPDAGLWTRMVAIPTTLSAAEFASSAGVSDPDRRLKQAFVNPMMIPVAVIMDPAMTLVTPLPLLLATGIKALDHGVERVTSVHDNPFNDAVSLLTIRLLAQALPRIHQAPDDLDARAQMQYGMFMSMAGSATGVTVNVSHSIGHVLGAHAGVPHGQTSCVMSPAVLRWSHDVTQARQRLISQALGAPESDAAALLTDLIRGLGLPVRLRDVGVSRADLASIADKTMLESGLKHSRKPVADPAEVMKILELAW